MANRKLKMYQFSKEQLYQAYIVHDMSLNELCAALDCSSSQLRWYLDKLGIKKNKRISKDTKTINDIKKLYLNGKSAAEIAFIYGCSESAVQNNLRKNGVPPKKKIVSNDERKKAYSDEKFMSEVMEFYKENEYLFKTYSKLAVKSGGSYDECFEYIYNNFFTYCVTYERLNNFKKYSLRNYLNLTMRHYLYRVFRRLGKEKEMQEEKKIEI